VSLNLLSNLPQHVHLFQAGVPLDHASHDVIQPTGTLAAGGALTTGLVLVEV
jgi:hypothetical protein